MVQPVRDNMNTWLLEHKVEEGWGLKFGSSMNLIVLHSVIICGVSKGKAK